MLSRIKITDFAIIDELSVEFHPGLNALTGETGAGKSIIIDALNLILGGRADTDFIRSGQSSATVEAVFQITDPPTLRHLENLGIDTEDGELIIKRIVSHSGKSRCFLNDNSITVGTLDKLGNRLVDIHGQHDHQALLHPETHVDLLDLYGKSMEQREKLSRTFSDYQTALKQLDTLKARESDRRERVELLQFQLSEIEGAGLSEGEEDELKSEKNKLQHAGKLMEAVERITQELKDSDGSVLDRLGAANRELQSLPAIDPNIEKQAERGQTAYYEIEELVEELRDYGRSIEVNPARLEEIEDRLAEINGLKRKYGNDVATVLEKRDSIAAELESLSSNQEQMDLLRGEIKQLQAALQKQSVALADKREKTALQFKKNVEKELRELNMQAVQLDVQFDYQPAGESFITFRDQRVKLTATGLGNIEFMFSPNPGEPLRPLAKIASGGELSRVMLALKSILNKQDPIPVMIFDEVDTGIGGKVAEKVGAKLNKISAGKQVFCITHLPQIAAMASVHYLVEKEVKGKRTRSAIRPLDEEERVEEIARMSGGEKITATTLQHAREMIQQH